LDYYSTSGIPVHVADGSESALDSPLPENVSYHHKPSAEYADRVLALLENVTTEHLVLAADDDFIVPGFILRADSILSLRPDCSAVFGRCYSFQRNEDDWSRMYGWAKAAEQETAAARLQAFFGNYFPLYYVPTRTQLVREVFLTFARTPVRLANLMELMFAARLLVAGKVTRIDELYSVRERRLEKPGGPPFPGVAALLAEDSTLMEAMSALVDGWLGEEGSGVFDRDIFGPYRGRGRGMMRRAGTLFRRFSRARQWPAYVRETEAVRQIRRAVRRHAGVSGALSPADLSRSR
jgi:glycosyltransferase domain-containing protein